MNTVDTSEETIKAEFNALTEQLGIGDDTDTKSEKDTPDTGIPAAAQIALGTEMIGGGLAMALNGFGGLGVEKSHCENFGRDLSVVICKHYPGGILAFLDRWKEELALIYSTGTLAGAVVMAIKQKREANAKAKPEEPTSKSESEPEKKSSFFGKITGKEDTKPDARHG